MSLKLKSCLCNRDTLIEILDLLGDTIAGHHARAGHQLALIGILTGGAPLAEHLADRIEMRNGKRPLVAYLDITLYRDDMITTREDPYSRVTEIPFAMRNKEVVLVDDVLFTGRTVRAAMSSLLALGRPRLIRLAVAVDRGGHELPIRADYVGRRLEVSRNEGIRVHLDEEEHPSGIFIYEPE